MPLLVYSCIKISHSVCRYDGGGDKITTLLHNNINYDSVETVYNNIVVRPRKISIIQGPTIKFSGTVELLRLLLLIIIMEMSYRCAELGLLT